MPSYEYNEIKSKIKAYRSKAEPEQPIAHSNGRSKEFSEIRDKIKSGGFTTSMSAEDVDTFLHDSRSFMEQSVKEYEALTWSTATSKEYQDKRNAASQDLTSRASQVRTYLNANKSSIDPETYETYMSYLDDFSKYQAQSATNFEKVYSGYGDFENEEQYNQYLQDYNQRSAWEQKYSGMTYSQLQDALSSLEAGAEKDWLDEYASSIMTLQDAETEVKKVDWKIQRQSALLKHYEDLTRIEQPEAGRAEIEKIASIYGSTTDLENEITEQKNKKYRLENAIRYNYLSDNEDFEELSKAQDFDSLIYRIVNNPDLAASLDKNSFIELFGNNNMVGTADAIYDVLTPDNIQRMRNEERGIFNYIYAKEGEYAAKKYLEYLQYSLDKRASDDFMKWVSDATQSVPVLSQTAASLLSTPLNLLGGVGLVDAAGQKLVNSITGEYKPVNYNRRSMYFSRAASTIRGTVAQNIADATGVIDLDEEKHPYLSRVLNGKGLADVYQLGMSMQDSAAIVGLSAINPALGTVGTALLGGSAGTQTMLDAVERGATDEQALSLGILSGAFEMLFEKYELGSLMKADDVMWKNIINQAITEGFGEGATEISNMAADYLIMAKNSNYERNIRQYMEDHPDWSYEEAEKQALIDSALQIAEASGGGIISGGIMSGGMSMIQKTSQKSREHKVYQKLTSLQLGDSAPQIIAEALNLNPDNAQAKKLKDQLDSGKQLSSGDLRAVQALAKQNVVAFDTEDAAGRLKQLGETGDIAAISKAVAKQVSDQKLTAAERKLISQSEHAQVVVDELKKQQDDGYDITNTQTAKEGQANRPVDSGEDFGSQVNYQASMDGQTVLKSMGEAVAIREIASVKDGKMTFRTEDGAEVDAQDIYFGSENEARVYNAVAQLSGIIDSTTANDLAQNLLKLGDTSSAMYTKAIAQAYKYGYYGYSPNSVSAKHTLSSQLTEAQRNTAYMYGKKMGEASGGQNSTSRSRTRRRGKVMSWGMPLEQLKQSFNPTQKQAFDIISTIADITGIDVVLYRSKAGTDGILRGGVVNGIDMRDSQGVFSWHDSKIYVDINAGLTNKSQMNDFAMYSMLRTFSHEFVHFIEHHNPVEYENFRDVVFEVMKEKGTDPEDLIDTYMMQHRNTTRDEASREVVAEAMTDILPQSQFVQQLAQKNRNLFQKLLDRLKEFIQEIKDHFASIGETSAPEVAAVTEQIDGAVRYVEKIVEAFDRVAVEAVERYQEGSQTQKNTAQGGVQYSLRVFEKDGRRFVEIDQDQERFNGHDLSEYPRIAKDIINEKFNGQIVGTDNKMFVNGSGRDEFANPSKRIPDTLYNAKMRTAGELDNLLDAGMNFRNAPDGADGHTHSDVVDGFDYFDTLFKIGNRYYAAVINIKNIKRGKLFKDVTKIEDVTQDIMSSYGKNPKSQFLRTSSKNSIRNPDGKVNNNSSNGQYQNQHRTTTLSNRMILEQAAKTVDAQNLPADQRSALRVFQNHLDTLRELEAEKAEQQEIVEDAKKKGTKSDAYKAAIRDRNGLTTRIRQESLKLLELENTAVLRRVLLQAKNVILDEQTAIRKKALEDYRKERTESRERSEMRRKLRKDIKDIYKLYNRTKDANNVKEEMKEFVSNALSSAELLLDDLYTDDDMIRNGLGIKLSPHEKALLDKAKKILYRLDNPPEASSVAQLDEWNRREQKLKVELSKTKTELQEAFLQARWQQKGNILSMVMQDLCDAYQELGNSKKPYIRTAFRPFVLMHLEGVRNNLKETRVEDMTLEQLTELHEAYTMVLTSIRDANKAFCANRSIDYMAKQLIRDFGGQRLSKSKAQNLVRNISDSVGWDYEKLYYALERINSPIFTQLFVNLANAEDIIMEDVEDSKAYRIKTVEKYGFNEWSINKKVDQEFVDNLGHSFRLTLGEIMLLYAYTRRGNVWKQLEVGGFVLEKKGWTDNRNATAYKLTPKQCLSITSTLTEEQKHFVEDMQKYLSDVMGEKGNEVSMKLYGVKLYNDANYCPIHIAGEYKARAAEAAAKKQAGFESLAHTGFTKTKNIDATATISLESFMDVWTDHVNEMSWYHGTVPALEDIRRVMNYSDHSDSQKDSESVRAMMENKFGKQAVQYFENLYREVNNGAVLDKLQSLSLPQKALRKNRKLAVNYRLSVLIQQTTSISRAFAIVDPKYFAGMSGAGASAWGAAKTVSNLWNKKQTAAYAEMVKYAPGVTLAKEIGGFDASGGGIRNYLMDDKKKALQILKTGTTKEILQAIGKKVDDNPIANLPNLADKIAWIEIWNACKRETKDKYRSLDPKSEVFMKRVGQRFTEVIRATQVYDSVFAKSPLLKSKNLAVQYMVGFMNESNVVANMTESAIRDIRKGGAENIKKGARKLFAVTRSIIFCNILKSLVYAMRDDDEEETYIEKYMQALTGNMIADFTPVNYIPFARDIWSLVKGYDVERPDIAIYSDLIYSIKKYYKVSNKDVSDMSPDEQEKWESQYTEAGWGLIGAIAGCFGSPIKNIYREIDSAFNFIRTCGESAGKTTWRTYGDACYQGIVEELPWLQSESKSDQIYEAVAEVDTKYLKRLQAGYLDSDGKLKTSYYTALRKGLRENDPRIKKAAQARLSGDHTTANKLLNQIVAEGRFTRSDIAAAIKAEYNQLKDD